MLKSFKLLFILFLISKLSRSQTTIYRDTISVFENGNKLTNPWAGGINYSSFSAIDLNLDGKKDLVAFDKICNSGGKLRAFLNSGTTGISNYKHSFFYQQKLPQVSEWALFYDYNFDGKEDLFTYTTGGVRVLKNVSTTTTFSFTQVKNLLLSDYNPNGSPNVSNIPCNPVGLPGIADIDGDGDLDILTYSVFGIKIEYHKNMSKELYGTADSLVFDMVDDCWGNMQESNCTVFLNQCPLKKLFDNYTQPLKKPLHAGSCIMCFDNNGDGDQDLLIGDVSCSTIEYVENAGSATNAQVNDTTKLFPNFPAKATANAIKMNSFPCTYYLDVDNDGFKDILASPNSIAGAENWQSVWYYKNTSATAVSNFVFQQKNFLQDGMVELGEGSYPVFFDADADGKKDIIVGNLGYYITNTNKSKMAYYRNIGTVSSPSFSLITRDYQNLSSYNLYSMAPTFGDLDNDGDQDLIIGSTNGRVHYFENTAGAGNAAVFGNYQSNYQNIIGSNFVYPQLFDIDKNGTLDLLLGSQNGRIAFWRNSGSITNANFGLNNAFLGGVDLKQAGYSTGYSTPFFYNDAGTTKLMIGSEIGNLYLFDNIDNNLGNNFNRVDTNLFKINEGTRSAPFYEDITNDGKRDLIIGNHAGGLAFFNSTNVNGVGVAENQQQLQVAVYPNPTNDVINIVINDNTYTELVLQIVDVLGNDMYTKSTYNKQTQVSLAEYSNGIYFLKIISKQNNTLVGIQKIIKH